MKKDLRGFTVIELLVVVSVIAILAVAGYANFRESGPTTRDAERKADLRELQAAIELYKNENGRYPEACNGPNDWSGQSDSSHACASGGQYILGLAPAYIPTLPIDPRPLPSGDAGYLYQVNSDGSSYKITVRNTVEAEIVTRGHEFQSCDVTNNSSGVCDSVYPSNSVPTHCQPSNAQFQTSYALWGGFATPNVTDPNSPFYDTQVERNTEAIICD